MSFTTFEARGGESWAAVARSVYGTDTGSRRIAQANPGLSEPLPAGVRVQVPPRDGDPRPLPRTGDGGPEEVEVRIAGERFRWWESVTIRRSIDNVDELSLSAPFEPDRPEFRRAFRPFSYSACAVAIGGDLVFSGTMLAVNPAATPDGVSVAAGAYSFPGVLADCTPSPEAESLEFLDLNLDQITRELLEPFGLRVAFEGAAVPGPRFADVSISVAEPVLPFLARLAKQRGLVIGSDPAGRLVYRQSVQTGAPVAVLRASERGPVTSVTPTFRPRQYFSHLTGLEPEIIGTEGGRFTVRNERLDAIRPHAFSVPDTEEGGAEAATRAKAGRMFGDAAAYAVELDTWRDPAGRLWAPNTTVELDWPSAMIYGRYEFLVRSVELRATGSERSATLALVLPGAYSGEIPGRLPWQD